MKKQYLVTFVTKKGGEENHQILTMADNAKEAVSIAKELWYEDHTMHAFRMCATLCKDEPETEESASAQSDDTAEECEYCHMCIDYEKCRENFPHRMKCQQSLCDSAVCCENFIDRANFYDITEESAPAQSENVSECESDLHEYAEHFEREQLIQEKRSLLKWAHSLTKRQINYLCDGGWYNDTIRGYLIASANRAGFTHLQIAELLVGLDIAFSDLNKSEADKLCCKRFLDYMDEVPF